MAIIDSCWKTSIQPLLLNRFPGTTPEQLKKAHAYVYGGAIMPDMGYYPFSNVFFTDIVHYVRSGDFVETLLSEAKNIDEYAFAVGALCHYYADIYGHSIGVNPSVPIVYKKLREKYGDTVYYEQDKISHMRMEFGFEVLQVARGNYASEDYHDFIGYKVSRPVLERAFKKTYGIELNDIFKNVPLSIGTFRWTVKNFFPVITKVAWAARSSEIKEVNPKASKKTYRYRVSRKEYYNDKEDDYKPGFFWGTFGWVIRLLPKIGPLRAFKFKVPGEDAEKLFSKSFNEVVSQYSAALNSLPKKALQLTDMDFDTGKKTHPGEYGIADDTYHKLLHQLAEKNYVGLTPDLKLNLVKYYDNAGNVISKKSCTKQRKINCEIISLRETKPVDAVGILK
jgi:hypothetical protein